jgi:hypothetical protein
MDAMNLSRPSWPALAVALLLAACSSPPTWDKAGASETTAQNDSNDCRVQARFAPLPEPERFTAGPPTASVPSNVLSREEQRATFETQEFQKCMTAKGYTAKR